MKPNFFVSLQEYLELLTVAISVGIANFLEFIRVVFRYYSNTQFRKIDLALLFAYLSKSPFAISKEFLKQKKEEDLYRYGETPLTSLEIITNECGIKSTDTVYELGCGRGRNCFWLNSFVHCKVVGIDYIPEFIEHASAIKNHFKVVDIDFIFEDILKVDLSKATVIYLYGTCLEDTFIEQLIERFKKLPAGTKIITISYPLTDYCQEPIFEVEKCFQVHYPWGEADVYLNILRTRQETSICS